MAARKNDTRQRIEGAYATPLKTVRYMVDRLVAHLPSTRGVVVDPAAGDGVFLREFRKAAPGRQTMGFEVNAKNASRATRNPTRVLNEDFIKCFAERDARLQPRARIVGIVGNPPYNCHESPYIRANKTRLKRAFAEIGVLNMYSMFIYASLQLLAERGILCMLTMDSFLTNRCHKRLREFILGNAEIVELLLAPRRLFHGQKADVRTVILTLRKTSTPSPSNRMRLVDRVASEEDYAAPKAEQVLCQSAYNKMHECNFVIGVPRAVRRLFTGLCRDIGSAVPGGAGISTGNDREYLRKGARPRGWLPFFKNPYGHRFFYETDTYITPRWDALARGRKNFIARNREFFSREGVSCSSMGIPFSAVLLPKGSLFGVNANLFPHSPAERFFLLGFLNSSLCTYMVRAVLNRTNMVTPGYVKRIPYRYEPGQTLCANVSSLAAGAYEAAKLGDTEAVSAAREEIDRRVFDLYEIPQEDRPIVMRFVSNLYDAL